MCMQERALSSFYTINAQELACIHLQHINLPARALHLNYSSEQVQESGVSN